MPEETVKTQQQTPIITGEHLSLPTHLSESLKGNAGDQGVVLRPVGSLQTNPFTPQDAHPSANSQPASASVAPTTASTNASSPSTQSGKES